MTFETFAGCSTEEEQLPDSCAIPSPCVQGRVVADLAVQLWESTAGSKPAARHEDLQLPRRLAGHIQIQSGRALHPTSHIARNTQTFLASDLGKKPYLKTRFMES